MEHLNGPVILSGFLMSSVVYWHVYFLVDYLLHKYAPTVHGRLKREDEIRKLMPLVITLVRMAFGLVVTLPSCIQAARTTPWGVDQPLNNAGKVCVVSQLAVWSNELPQARFYSMELFVHHILCLVATANIILSPPIHQIKPLYIYFGSLCGDIGPGFVMILRIAGHKLKTSKLLYNVSLGSTLLLIFCRIGGAFYTLTHVLTDPYNLADWVSALGILLFGSYSTYTTFQHLRRLEIIRVDPVGYKVTCFCKFAVPISHSLLAVACSATLLSSLFLYGIYLGRPLRPGETHRLSLHGLIAVALGMTGALIARLAYPHNASRSDPWGRLYVPFSTILTGMCISGIGTFTNYTDRNTVLASIGVSVPLFFSLARVAQYYAAKDVEAVRDAKLSPGNSVIRRHVEIALEHAVIFIILLGILIINLLSLPEAARLSIAACLVVQLRYHWNIVPLAAANTHGLAGVLLAIVLIVLEPGFIAFATTGRFIRLESSWSAIFQNYLLLGGTVMAAISVPRSEPVSRPCETVKEPCRSKRFHPTTILFVFFCILQAMLIAKYMTFDGKTPEICPGFVNFRSIFSDVYTWVGALHMASLPVVVLRELE
ncbi:hypothetical protein FOXG_19199 [Fusarium oxysporum f. sp. lycopersici 4287]|uniref:Uncharacterized protein n=2 Tax=Fusarium oxysporum TaxID=5507 RepID=A0A0J9UY11_FUSO4|nr:hypothetical protein FOXG_19199 [Fusarium oxysporum f. sp. lycopersici 4287]EXK33356.1 hypothetical protein FOMG_12060 [Fusarium oxysporum f. sp. melonis 26406]KAJ9423346.1 hypothetical protein QL093DRAFT_1290431 [Fusarium oxysporum]KNB03778.1 hypothetical protein FOXG_19199 [Fusarium oxysporum f. sp. lycopersici 4287]